MGKRAEMIFLLPSLRSYQIFFSQFSLTVAMRVEGVTACIEATNLWWEIGGLRIMSLNPSSVYSLSRSLGCVQVASEMEKTW